MLLTINMEIEYLHSTFMTINEQHFLINPFGAGFNNITCVREEKTKVLVGRQKSSVTHTSSILSVDRETTAETITSLSLRL